VVPLLLFLQLRVEPELVVVLRDDVPVQASSETTRLAVAVSFWEYALQEEN
jgi:2-keto-4-pentenoate hydratase